ncbi:hypothetical protein PVL30_002978 [Lodderomyces elongisporus]|uniref:uncharacterized protein n=1 Tax=Lodderomyces elongisporus TaxID=36914 RepID=UPI00291E62D4|nr:uncharacterized protein PVL30_002978 [Lodderomyces elongisporus]WLF79226.1 hypothetical protein PVL30_002978 [Lodderomyces elongisporus]
METNYRSYQQVLNISVKPTTTTPCLSQKKASSSILATTSRRQNQNKITKAKKSTANGSGVKDHTNDSTAPIKRRTKTGCFTCRKRKKKCDEDKVNGKCQACTRNFLECCWPETNINSTIKSQASSMEKQSSSTSELAEGPKTPELKMVKPCTQSSQVSQHTSPVSYKKCDIKSLLTSPPASPEIKPTVVYNPYPSPKQSPNFKEAKLQSPLASTENICGLVTLPPLLLNSNYRLNTTSPPLAVPSSSSLTSSSPSSSSSSITATRINESNVRGMPRQVPVATKETVSPIMNDKSVSLERKEKNVTFGSKFIITSFNADKSLCEIKN